MKTVLSSEQWSSAAIPLVAADAALLHATEGPPSSVRFRSRHEVLDVDGRAAVADRSRS